MPTISFSVERMGYAEQFIANFHRNMPEKLTAITEELKEAIAEAAPTGKKTDARRGTLHLWESFYVVPSQEVGEGSWEATVNTRLPVRARVQEFGSGYWGAGGGPYPITPKTKKLLNFYWENAPQHMGGPGWYQFPRVMHPGVHPQMYIRGSIVRMRDRIREAFGEAIRMSAIDVGGVPRGPGYP